MEPPPPALTVARDPGAQRVTLSWPGRAAGFSLLSAADLSPDARWVPVTNAPVLSNGEFSVVLPLTNARGWILRLSKP